MKILVGVDKSPESHNALRYVCHLLDHFDAQVDALHVQRDVMDITLESFDIPFVKQKDLNEFVHSQTREVEQEIVSACEICLAGKVPCEPRMVMGEPSDELMRASREGDYDLIVLGSHGFSSLKGFLLGTVHTKVLHHANCPVLIVREYREIRRVLVAYRGSRCDQAALRFVAPLIVRKRPQITVLHVQETYLDESDGFAEACLLQGRRTLTELGHAPLAKEAKGDFVDETLREVLAGDYDLVVLGAYGHERSKYLKVISDEALHLVSKTQRPVLVYRDKHEA
jgi:nucleotide-binding universal stress UspA family protein